jgi:hypothetical protein
MAFVEMSSYVTKHEYDKMLNIVTRKMTSERRKQLDTAADWLAKNERKYTIVDGRHVNHDESDHCANH